MEHICRIPESCEKFRRLITDASIEAMRFKREWRHSLVGQLENVMETVKSCSGHHGCPNLDDSTTLETAEGTIGLPDRIRLFDREV